MQPALLSLGRWGGVLLSAGLLSAALAQAPAAPVWGKASANRIYAQQLVNDLMAADPTLLSVALHVTPAGATQPQIVAHTQDLIGKLDSPADMAMIKADQTVIGPEMVEHTTQVISRMVVHAPLRDRSGAIIGLAVFSFKRHAGLEKLDAHVRAEGMLTQLAQKIPSVAALLVRTDGK
jgi:hypothetical protein